MTNLRKRLKKLAAQLTDNLGPPHSQAWFVLLLGLLAQQTGPLASWQGQTQGSAFFSPNPLPDRVHLARSLIMPLSVGDKLGPYEILALIGKGGMGEVYRARDTKLKRDVALKVLPEAFIRDPGRMARFQREAEVLASLNHPNIAAIYGVEGQALVMELVEGESPKGPMPFDEAWRIASQIADALEYAHDKGVVHRDLKPTNVKVTPEGVVKLLDFGLAKAFSREAASPSAPSPPDAANAPTLTLTVGATEVGMILGTAAYMSPEQAKGKVVDKRADIWAFGVLLYALVTGEHLFKGENVSDTLAQVLTKQPDLEQVPARARRLLRECLEKDPRQRLRDIGDAKRLLIEEAPMPPPAAARRPFHSLGWVAAGVLAAALVASLWILWRQSPPEERAMRFEVNPPPGAEFVLGASGGAAISPDGRAIAFVAVSGGSSKLWVRSLDSIPAHELAGTDGAEQPFWSPESRSLGFFAGGKLKRIDVTGGPPVPVADAQAGRGATWLQDGTIIFTPLVTTGLQRVVASGGAAAVLLTNLDSARGESSHRWPQFLPGGKRFIYYIQSLTGSRIAGTYLGSLDRPQEKTQLTQNPYNGLYAPPLGNYPGYLLFLRENTLIAQPFDPARGQLSGEAVPVPGAEAVSSASGINRADFSVSNQGALVFGRGSDHYQLTWFDREGKVLSTVGQPDRYLSIRISPDGKGVAASRADSAGRQDVWRIEFTRGAPNRLTFDGNGYRTAWSPDGRRIFYGSNGRIFETEANGTGVGKAAITQHSASVNDWSPDGRYLMLPHV
jgi:hypothetical protein